MMRLRRRLVRGRRRAGGAIGDILEAGLTEARERTRGADARTATLVARVEVAMATRSGAHRGDAPAVGQTAVTRRNDHVTLPYNILSYNHISQPLNHWPLRGAAVPAGSRALRGARHGAAPAAARVCAAGDGPAPGAVRLFALDGGGLRRHAAEHAVRKGAPGRSAVATCTRALTRPPPQGIRTLASELATLRQTASQEMQRSVFANYDAFIRCALLPTRPAAFVRETRLCSRAARRAQHGQGDCGPAERPEPQPRAAVRHGRRAGVAARAARG